MKVILIILCISCAILLFSIRFEGCSMEAYNMQTYNKNGSESGKFHVLCYSYSEEIGSYVIQFYHEVNNKKYFGKAVTDIKKEEYKDCDHCPMRFECLTDNIYWSYNGYNHTLEKIWDSGEMDKDAEERLMVVYNRYRYLR